MKLISEIYKSVKRSVKVLQYGQGNFLRAFADYYIQEMNDKNGFD
jgi:tagaturonate reductase